MASRLARAAAENGADLYHFHDPELIPAMRALRRRTGVPVVYDIHEAYPEAIAQRAWIPAPMRPLVAHVAGAMEQRNIRHFDGLVAADDALYDAFSSVHAHVARVRNYPPLELFPAERPASGRPPTMAYIGSISRVRGLEDLLDALHIVRGSVPDARLLLAGSPTEDAARLLADAIHEFGASLEYVGAIPYGDVASLLQRADVGLSLLRAHPKYEKNVPTKVFDYMAAGLPYIATTSSPLMAVTGGTGGRFVTPGAPAEAAQALLELFEDRDAAAALGAEGRHVVESRLNWTCEENALQDLYETLLR